MDFEPNGDDSFFDLAAANISNNGGTGSNDPRFGASGTGFASHTGHTYAAAQSPNSGYNLPNGHVILPPRRPVGQDQSILQLSHNIMTMETQLRDSQNHNEQILYSIMQKIKHLEAEMAALKLADTSKVNQQIEIVSEKTTSRKDIPTEVKGAIRDAVQRQAKVLIGVSKTREADETGASRMKLVMPEPYTTEGFEPRSSGGHAIFNPDWKAGQKDAYNRRYINAITKSVMEQVQEGTVAIPQEYRTMNLLQHAAKQYFKTLADHYDRQVDEEKAEKQNNRLDTNKLLQRKKKKHTRRFTAWPTFQQKHDIPDDLTHLIDIGYMSADDENNANVSSEEWTTEANKVCGPGQTALEIQRVLWRTEKLTRFYYALDKEGFGSVTKRTKVVHTRFHGFLANASSSPPKRHCHPEGLVPKYIVNQDWLKQTQNQDLPLDESPEPQGWESLVIDDGEIDPRDLRALHEWKEERQVAASMD